MLFNDKKNTVLRGEVLRLERKDEQTNFVTTLKLIQSQTIMDYTLIYESSEARNKDYQKISRKKKL